MKRILTGIQSTNNLTLGNYLGAIKPLINSKDELFMFIADLHSITVPFNPDDLKENRINTALLYKSMGLDFKKNKIFFQSDVPEHNQLNYILLCHSNLGELQRMTQFKDKSSKYNQSNKTVTIPTGILIYPVLMAADILLYNPDVVHVGKDQKQHIELTRDLAERMNKKYKTNLFKIPEHHFNKVGAKILDLQNPEIKMSKSNENTKGTIFVLDNEELIIKKIMAAKTDSLDNVKYDEENQLGISNLLTIYSSIKNISIEDAEKHFTGKKYGEFKREVADAVVQELKKIQDIFYKLKNNKSEREEIFNQLAENAKQCRKIASKTMEEVYKCVGLSNE